MLTNLHSARASRHSKLNIFNRRKKKNQPIRAFNERSFIFCCPHIHISFIYANRFAHRSIALHLIENWKKKKRTTKSCERDSFCFRKYLARLWNWPQHHAQLTAHNNNNNKKKTASQTRRRAKNLNLRSRNLSMERAFLERNIYIYELSLCFILQLEWRGNMFI